MIYLFSFITAMAMSMVIIPIMVRLAPRFGMMDRPAKRKVHKAPIPRAGGVGIVLGSLLPVIIWLPIDDVMRAYLFGTVVLLLFGIWDDIREIGHKAKFIGQLLAVVPVVYFGDLYVTHLPLIPLDPLPDSIGKPFTVFAMVGMINAINHSDGLDGLAGGMSLLSLSCIGYLAVMADGYLAVIIVLSTIGGVFGFLRYNTYPARVFMGDGGSQFLGYTLGFLAVLLTQRINPALSPALVLPILGLPIIDILAVFVQRVYHGMNWFRASRNHIHHRLLTLRFHHYEAVVIIYAIQILFIVSAIFLSYESDTLILAIYLGVCALIFVALTGAEHRGWRAHARQGVSRFASIVQTIKKHRLVTVIPLTFVAIAVPALFILVSLWTETIPRDLGIASAALAVVLLAALILHDKRDSMLFHGINYITASFIVYLHTTIMAQQFPALNTIGYIYFAAILLAVGLSVRYSRQVDFKTTPMDYLIVFIVLFASALLLKQPGQSDLGSLAIKLIILFYGCELLITRMQSRWNTLNLSTLATLSLLAVRGIL